MNKVETGSKKSIKRINTERAILNAAIKLFTSYGFERTSTKQIAELSGFSEGLIFKYFKDKSRLYLTIYQEWMDSILMEFRDLPESKNLEDELRILVRAFIDNYDKNLDIVIFHLEQSYYFAENAELEAVRQEFIRQRLEILNQRLEVYCQNRKIDVELLISAINGYSTINLLFRKWKKEEYDHRVEQFVTLLLHGIE